MAVDQKLQLKDLLAESQIRTMKKDLKKLRETDVVKESQKISQLNVAKKIEPQKIAVKPAPAPTPDDLGLMFGREISAIPTPSVPKIQEEPRAQTPETGISAKADDSEVPSLKANMSEEGKQQIFLLEKQKEEFKDQLQVIVRSKGEIAAKQTSANAQKNNWQAKLNPLIEAESKATDQQRESIEKQRWPIEQELSKLEKTIKDLNVQYRDIEEKEIQLRANMVGVDTSLDDIYATAKSRAVKMPEVAPAPKPPAPPAQKPTPPPILRAMTTPTPPKPVVKPIETPQEQIEKLKASVQASAKVENVQRKKFLEDVEAWANSNK